jgi:acyl carrier protein
MADHTKFEDADYDLSYCEGDPTLDDVNAFELMTLVAEQTKIELHPNEAHRDLASVGLLADMYGDKLDVR